MTTNRVIIVPLGERSPEGVQLKAAFNLESVSFSAEEQATLSFRIFRTVRSDQTLSVDWIFSGVSVNPLSGTTIFNPTVSSILVQVQTQSVSATEQGTLTLSNPQYISGEYSEPVIGTVPSATITINNVVGPPDTGVQDVIWLHDHNTEPLGSPSGAISGLFTISTDEYSTPDQYLDYAIDDSTPLYPGKKYWRTNLVAHYPPGQPQDSPGVSWRTERSSSIENFQRTNMVSVGGDQYIAPEKIWYGILFRMDRMDKWGRDPLPSPKGGGIIVQWHMRNFWDNPDIIPPYDLNPHLSLVHHIGGIYLRLEANEDNGGSDLFLGPVLDESIAGTAGNNYLDGETHAFIFEILWDTRTQAQGSQGILRLYVDDNPVPAVEWLNKQNVHPMPWLDQQLPPRMPYWKHGGYRRDFETFSVSLPEGTTQQFSWGNFTLQGENANREGILQALDYANVIDIRAFPGAEGHGTDTTHGRGGTVYIVTSLADSGAGTLREAMLATGPRIIVFAVSGTIELQTHIRMQAANSNVAIFGQTSPGDGICLRLVGLTDQGVIKIGSNDISSPCHDVLIQHLKIRHGSPNDNLSPNESDDITINDGCYNIVIDHCSITWANDEVVSCYGWAIHDVTFSNNILGEGMVYERRYLPPQQHNAGQNAGPLVAGTYNQTPIGNITFHHNLLIHNWIRNIKLHSICADDQGVECINNVNYNCYGNHYRISQGDQGGTNKPQRMDVVNCLMREGGDTDASKCFMLMREDDVSPNYKPIEIYFVGNTYWDIAGNPHPNYNANNYAPSMMGVGSFDGVPTATYTIRPSMMASQPTHPVTIQTPQEAYDHVVTNRKIGAYPHDSVDVRLFNAPANHDAWNLALLPTPLGGDPNAYPTLSYLGYYQHDPAKSDTDTSGNGLPDYYQVNVLSKDINDAYNPAATYTLGNGYTDIENWAYSLWGE